MGKNSIIKSIISLSFLGLLAKFFGLIREGVFAAYFGTSVQMDLFGLLTGYLTTAIAVFASSLGVSYSPYYVRSLQQQGERKASLRFSNLLNQFILFSIILYIVVAFALPAFADYFCERLDGISRENVILYSRLIFIAIITGGGTRLFVMALNGLRKYGWMQITQLLYAVIAIVLTVLFGKRYGVIVLVLSFLLNSVVQFVVLWQVYFRGERDYSLRISFVESDISDTWKALIPVFLGTETYMVGLTIDRTLGLSLGIEGAVAAINYAGVLFGMINTLITSPINTVFLTEMYRNYYSSGNRDVLYRDLRVNINHLSFILVPISCFLCISSNDFISIVLKRGAFDEQSAIMTSSAFFLYALASPFYAFRNIYSGVHRAMNDNYTPMWSGIIFLFLNYVLAGVFSKHFGILGITLGSLLAMVVSFLFQYFIIKCKHGFQGTLLNSTFKKILCGSIISMVIVFCFFRVCSIQNIYFRFVIEGIVFFAMYSVFVYLTKCEEAKILLKRLIRNKHKATFC